MRRARPLRPRPLEGYAELARVLLKKGQLHAALVALVSGLRLAPGDPELLDLRAAALAVEPLAEQGPDQHVRHPRAPERSASTGHRTGNEHGSWRSVTFPVIQIPIKPQHKAVVVIIIIVS